MFLLHGDITKVAVSAIVNAANTHLAGGGGVDGAIHKAGGAAIYQECKAIIDKNGLLKPGDAVYTSGGLMPAKYVIHTVGPIYSKDGNCEDTLRKAYINSLKLADKLNCTSIAFPNISTGVYGYPKHEAAEIAIKAVTDYIKESASSIRPIFVCFDEENYDIYNKLLNMNY